jgi:rhamnogalacturonyl hydrolase YesR
MLRARYDQVTRREALAFLAVLAAKPASAVPPDSLSARMPRSLSPGVASILARILNQDPSSLNTDWFGTMQLVGALQWSRRGISEVEPFARAWLHHHLNAKDVAKYTGNRSRVVWAGGIPLTTYAGHFGISQVCEEMVAQFKDERARKIAIDVASIVLHRTARNRLGLVGHDDTAAFAIPDVTFFAVSSLMIAAQLDPQYAASYRDQGIYQLRTSIDTFLIRDTGLAKTLYRGDSVGKTYWTRASGWLLWAMVAMLRRLDRSHPAFTEFENHLRRLADGMIRVQETSGGFHVLLDDPSTPLDPTGPAMFALGIHEAVRSGWLPRSYASAAGRAWKFVSSKLTADGVLEDTYYLWAVPAENREMKVHDESTGWAMGFVLAAAAEMTT